MHSFKTIWVFFQQSLLTLFETECEKSRPSYNKTSAPWNVLTHFSSLFCFYSPELYNVLVSRRPSTMFPFSPYKDFFLKEIRCRCGYSLLRCTREAQINKRFRKKGEVKLTLAVQNQFLHMFVLPHSQQWRWHWNMTPHWLEAETEPGPVAAACGFICEFSC